MREIKFNIWVEDEHIMLRGVKEIREYAKRTGEVWSEVMIPGHFSNLRHLQFTGILDKNGKEIYEGDILEFDGNKEIYGEVVFDIFRGMYMKDGKNKDQVLYEQLGNNEISRWKIIGNKFNI